MSILYHDDIQHPTWVNHRIKMASYVTNKLGKFPLRDTRKKPGVCHVPAAGQYLCIPFIVNLGGQNWFHTTLTHTIARPKTRIDFS